MTGPVRRTAPARALVASLLVASLLVAALAGCAETTIASRPRLPAEPPSPISTATSTGADLAALKQQAGIPDCPASDPSVVVVPKGLPDVVLPCLGGGRSVRLAGLRGRPMLINIWAQWCGPCRDEAPFLAEVAESNRSDLAIIGIDHADPRPDLAIEFARLASWRFPQLSDPEVVLRSTLQVTGPPQTFFVRPDGTIAYRHAGPFDSAAEIRTLAERHLGVTP